MSSLERFPRSAPEAEPSPAQYVDEFSDVVEREWASQVVPHDELFGRTSLAADLERAQRIKGEESLTVAEEDLIYRDAMALPKRLLMHRIEKTQRFDRPDSDGSILSFFQKAAEDEKLFPQLEKAFGKDPRSEVSLDEMKAVLSQNKIDDRTFAAMIASHQERVREQIKMARLEVEQLQEELMNDIARLRQAGVVTVSEDIVAKRLARTRIVFIDSLSSSRAHGSTTFLGPVALRLGLSSLDLKHTYYHEMTHALLSGVQVRAWQEGHFTEIQRQKYGLRFEKPVNSSSEKNGFTGGMYEQLNEAVTEELTIQLLGDTEKYEDATYLTPRSNLWKIVESGIPRQDFFAAYQESITVEKPTVLPTWQRIQDEMRGNLTAQHYLQALS